MMIIAVVSEKPAILVRKDWLLKQTLGLKLADYFIKRFELSS